MIKYILTPLLLVLCTVVCGQGITHYQYWFDGDVDSRVTTATSGNVDVQVDVTALPDGVHTIHYRAVDDQGRWTAPECYYFIKHKPLKQTQRTPATLTKYEYWFDNDIANRIVTENTNGIVDIQSDITTLTDGVHTINYRMADSYGSWTPPESYYFIKHKPLNQAQRTPATLTKYEYWFDNDIANRIVTENTSGIVDIQTDITALTDGVHTPSPTAWLTATVVGHRLRVTTSSNTNCAPPWWMTGRSGVTATGSMMPNRRLSMWNYRNP